MRCLFSAFFLVVLGSAVAVGGTADIGGCTKLSAKPAIDCRIVQMLDDQKRVRLGMVIHYASMADAGPSQAPAILVGAEFCAAAGTDGKTAESNFVAQHFLEERDSIWLSCTQVRTIADVLGG